MVEGLPIKKISEMTEIDSVDGFETIPVIKLGSSKKAVINKIKDFILSFIYSDLNSTDFDKGASLVRLSSSTTVRNAINQKQFIVNGAQPGVDAYNAIATQVALCKASGGGIVLLPYIGGYSISNTIIVDFDNCTILLDDDVLLTKTDTSNLVGPDAPYQTGVNGLGVCAFAFCGQLMGPVENRKYINRPQLIGLKPVRITGNGAAASVGYTYVVGSSGLHAPVVFQGTINARCENIRAQLGLNGNIIAAYSPQIIIDKCPVFSTQYDNGIVIIGNREHIAPFSDTDPTTWSLGTIRDCLAISCKNHGIGTYGAVGVNIVNPVVISCGNNDGTVGAAGPAGGINVEHDGINTLRDYRVTVVNPRVDNSWGFGLRTNCIGTRVIGGRITGVKNPTNYVDSTPKVWGSGVFVQGAGTLRAIGLDIENCDQFGYRLNSAGVGFYPSLYVDGGKISGNGRNPAGSSGSYALSSGLYAIDFNELVISPSTLFSNNGNTVDTNAGSQYTINLNNSVNNIDAGLACISGRFENNKGGILLASRVGTIDTTKGISGIGNGTGWASAYYMIYVNDKVTNLHISNINLAQSGNSKTARIAYIGSVVNLYAYWNSIIGDQTNTSLPKLQVVSLSGSNNSNAVVGSIFTVATATYTPNSAYGSVIFGSPYLTANMTIANDVPSVPPVEGQTINFTFIQDATGGRSITWQSLWKGATLTGPGTANQRAFVTFRYISSQWVQVFNSGWYS